MEELKKIIQIVEKRGGISAQIFTNNSKEKRLYQEVVKGRITDEASAKIILYADDEDGEGLKMVKSRLRKKLMNQLFLMDDRRDGLPVSHSVEQNCLAKFYQARVLMDAGGNDIALPILKQVLAKAVEYDFNYIVSLSLRLIMQACVNLKEKAFFYKALTQLNELSLKLTADQESELLFFQANIELSHSVVARKIYLKKIEEVLSKMFQLWQVAQTFETFHNYYRLSIWSHELTGEFDKIVELTKMSEKVLKEHNIVANRIDIRFNKFIQVYAHFRAKKLEEGLNLANSYLSYFSPSSNNWFAYMENYILLAIHAKKYEVGHMLLHQVQENPFIKKINKLAQERWSLIEAYLQFVSPQAGSPLKWQSFVQNAPSYSKDKEGFNVAILILQVMYFLDIVDYEALEYRVDSLKKYAQHHFKDSFSERSRIFFKLLTVLVRSNFEFATTQKKGQYLYNKLQRTPTPGDAYAEIEIIPYEHLWELVLDRIKKSAHFAK
ncbi:hypothetical protein [Rufibacter latericius]|uniref:Uncharacterized protein n=1 Tax=Rufibacter latericius TaxID=2487040 RepID=A0A3M9MJD8_9BACT|nr:hypothetical protein [Rufibacter latericius]RNI24973.1 hypothetical protein EFB08_16150 [Rufibacter latericius]